MLDVEVDEHAVDDYIQRQEGHEYHVSGYQVVTERRGKGAGPVRRR
jgi:hypothetical protein